MKHEIAMLFPLAPLQRVMLADSLAAPDAGHHVEQVELVLAPGEWRGRVAEAWRDTVERTEALRIAFRITGGVAEGSEFVETQIGICVEDIVPSSWEEWFAADRCRPLLVPHEVPWRVVYWPDGGRFIWTFHHALLDGRSITSILRGFLARLAGAEAEDLALSKWQAPSPAAVALAEKMFQQDFPPEALKSPLFASEDQRAYRSLGEEFQKNLQSVATSMNVTAATVLIWAWGQALADATAAEAVTVEQLRCGAPQPGTAGFLMNTLPVRIERARSDEMESSLRQFRTKLVEMRQIEGVSRQDLPAGAFPEVDYLGSSMIMIEQGTLAHVAGGVMVESITLHECKGESLMASAYVLPDLRLEVEGPGKRELLDGWIRVLERMCD